MSNKIYGIRIQSPITGEFFYATKEGKGMTFAEAQKEKRKLWKKYPYEMYRTRVVNMKYMVPANVYGLKKLKMMIR